MMDTYANTCDTCGCPIGQHILTGECYLCWEKRVIKEDGTIDSLLPIPPL
jgi:hypothetical protein